MKSKTVFKVYVLLSIFLVVDLVSYFSFGVSLRGYYADIILFWIWFFGTLLMIVTYWSKRVAKFSLMAMVSIILLSNVPMGIPFYAFVLSSTPFGLWLDKDLNSLYRAQIISYSVMTPPWLEIIEKRGVFERKIMKCTDNQILDDRTDVKIRNAKDLIFESETDRTLTLKLLYGGANKTLVFDKEKGNILEERR